jgi:hypothetical protein
MQMPLRWTINEGTFFLKTVEVILKENRELILFHFLSLACFALQPCN